MSEAIATKRTREDDAEVPAPSKELPPRKKAKKDRKFERDVLAESEYYFDNGLRWVYPYYFTFTSHAKGRWVGSTIYNLFCKEFQAETPEYYARALETGKIAVNGIIANKDTVIKNNDLITHKVHRHEPPVVGTHIDVIHNDDELVVVSKPASIPVHPCGRYRNNTVWFIMAKEHKLSNLHTVHRIDRLTSGILMFAKSVGVAQRLEKQIRGRQVSKKYVCKVDGEFPSEKVECSQPISIECHRLGVCRVDPAGKSCSTVFERLHFDGTNSIVACYPTTGRMHQIRVHLQWLGYPIVNDPVYNHPAWGKDRGKGGVDPTNMEQIIAGIAATHYSNDKTPSSSSLSNSNSSTPSEAATLTSHSSNSNDFPTVTPSSSDSGKPLPSPQTVTDSVVCEQSTSIPACNRPSFDISKLSVNADCTECSITRRHPSPDQLVMYLHALSYQGPGWEFHTELPSWASDCHQTI